MMRALFVLALLASLAMGQTSPPHGPYANRPDYVCYRGETDEHPPRGQKKKVHCECKLHCDEHGNAHEANDCQTYCGPKNARGESDQCVCHADEACGEMFDDE